MPTDRPEQRIADILKNLRAIETYTEGMDREAFFANPLVCDAVERCLERACEAARKLDDRFDAEAPPEVDLHAMRRFGSVLRHDYDDILREEVWQLVVERLPAVKCFFARLQERYPLSQEDQGPGN